MPSAPFRERSGGSWHDLPPDNGRYALQPSDEIIGKAIETAPEGWALVAFAIVATLFVIVKWALPLIKELREKRMDIERYRIEVDEKSAAALDDRERERIRNTQALVEQQRQTNENTKALTTVMVALQGRLEESADRSRDMGAKVDGIDATTRHTDDLVADIHNHIFNPEGTD